MIDNGTALTIGAGLPPSGPDGSGTAWPLRDGDGAQPSHACAAPGMRRRTCVRARRCLARRAPARQTSCRTNVGVDDSGDTVPTAPAMNSRPFRAGWVRHRLITTRRGSCTAPWACRSHRSCVAHLVGARRCLARPTCGAAKPAWYQHRAATRHDTPTTSRGLVAGPAGQAPPDRYGTGPLPIHGTIGRPVATSGNPCRGEALSRPPVARHRPIERWAGVHPSLGPRSALGSTGFS